jgi:hypothetical protein
MVHGPAGVATVSDVVEFNLKKGGEFTLAWLLFVSDLRIPCEM